jgi:DNA modification methylase
MVILLGDAALVLKDFVDGCISLTVTSPPYDNLRTYGGHSFDFEEIACELYRVTQDGGIVVWIIGDRTEDGDESGTSFRQALYFKEIGFKLHDTMIYARNSARYPESNRYSQLFDFMFILSKGKPKTFNPIKIDRSKYARETNHAGNRNRDGVIKWREFKYAPLKSKTNIWEYAIGYNIQTQDAIAFEHPAIFPDKLAVDHIQSWSNEGDLILDPFSGSGTTLKAAQQLNRKWIGIEINPDYVQLAKKRLTPYVQQQRLEQFLK